MKTHLYRLPQTAAQYWAQIRNNKKLQGSLLIIMLTMIFFQSGSILQGIDFAAAPIDIGILSLFPLAILSIFLLLGLTLISQEWLWPAFSDFRKYQFVQHFNSISPWQQFKLYGISFCCLLLFSVLVLIAIF